MQKSSLLQLLSGLSTEEGRSFYKFVRSPYHNQREDVVALFDFINGHIRDNWNYLTKENAFAQVYPGEVFDLKKIRYTMSFLLKTLEAFFIHQEATLDPVQEQILLLRAYRKRKEEKFFTKTLRRATDYHQRTFRDEAYYDQAYLLEREKYLFSAGQKRNVPSQLPLLNHTLDTLYLIQRLKQSCLLQAHQAVFREEDDPRMLNLLIDFLDDSEFLEHPLLAIYFYYLKAVREPREVRFYQIFKEKILEGESVIPKKERRTMILLAINYGIQRYNLGEEAYLREVFELYQTGLEGKLILEGGRLSRFAFKNIVGIAIRLEEYAWTEGFIENFQMALSNRHRKNYVHFCLSKLRYSQGRHQDALKRLIQVEYEDLYLNLDAKVLLMKMYYELDEWQALDSLLTSAKRFIQRKKIMGYHRESYLNIVHFIRKLVDRNPYDRAASTILREQIQQAPALAEREWLLEQLPVRS